MPNFTNTRDELALSLFLKWSEHTHSAKVLKSLRKKAYNAANVFIFGSIKGK